MAQSAGKKNVVSRRRSAFFILLSCKGRTLMTLKKLAACIQTAEDIEATCRLNHKYLRCMDGELWDEIETASQITSKTATCDRIKTTCRTALMRFFKWRLTYSQSLHHPPRNSAENPTGRAKRIMGQLRFQGPRAA